MDRDGGGVLVGHGGGDDGGGGDGVGYLSGEDTRGGRGAAADRVLIRGDNVILVDGGG